MHTLPELLQRCLTGLVDIGSLETYCCSCRLASASGKNDDMEAAIAQIGIEVYSAMDSALQ